MNRVGRALAVVALLAWTCGTANAQITVLQEYLPGVGVDTDRPGAELPERLEYTVHRTEITLQLPTVLSSRLRAGGRFPDVVWTNRVGYELLQPNPSGAGEHSFLADTDQFHVLDFRSLLTKFVSEHWMVTAGGGVNLAVDTFDGAALSDATFAAAVIAQRAFDSGWVVGMGGIYSQLTGRSTVLPNLYVGYKGERHRLKVALPRSHYWYATSPRVAFGLLGELDGDEYRLVGTTADLYDGLGRIVQEDVDVNLSYSRITVAPAVNVTLGAFQVRLASGWAFQRTFEFRATEEDETLRFPPTWPADLRRRKVDYGLEGGVFAAIRLRFAPLTG